jgi:hypothetical protein
MLFDGVTQLAQASYLRRDFGVLIPITWFFIFQPYLSPLPTSNDLQPVSLILAGLALLLDTLYRGRLQKRFMLLFLLAVAIEVLHVTLFMKPAGIYLATYIFLVFAWKYSAHVTAQMMKAILAFHLFGILWQTLDPSSFSTIFEHFLRELKHTGHSGRGATGFTPEPTFAGALSTVYAITYFRFFAHNQRRVTNTLFFLMYLLSIILTSSSLGYLFSPLVLVTWFLQGQQALTQHLRLYATAILVFTLATGLFEMFEVGQRGLVLAKILLQNPEVVLLDSSVQERTRSLYIGYQSLQTNLWGFGHGNFAQATQWAQNTLDLERLFENSRDIAGTASGAGSVMAGTGILGTVFYLLVFFRLRGRSTLSDIGLWIVSLSMFTFSFSPAHPLIYILLVMRQHHGRIYGR